EMLRGNYGRQVRGATDEKKSEPIVDSNFRTYHFKHAPKTFHEILDKWAASLKYIQGQKYIPKAIKKFVEELINFNETKEFENLFYMKQTDEILNSKLCEEDSYAEDDATQDLNQVAQENELDDDELPGYDDSNEEAFMRKIDEDALDEKSKLPLANDNKDSSKFISGDVLNAFRKYQNEIPKTRRVFTLYGCNEITEGDIQHLSQDFANHIKWKCESASKDIQDYFDSSCEMLDNSSENKDLKHFDPNVQFLKNNMHFFQEMLTEEHLKMTSSYPLFHGTFTSDRIKHAWRHSGSFEQ
ncbi:10732_t:CDS:10, partial [Ambispora leptoticha]